MRLYRLHSKQALPIPGQILHYKVRPFLGYSTKWVTEITHVKDGEYFVDEQRFDPYFLWHHKHFINPISGGVDMEDIIDYKIRFGLFGQLVQPMVVKSNSNEFLKPERINYMRSSERSMGFLTCFR